MNKRFLLLSIAMILLIASCSPKNGENRFNYSQKSDHLSHNHFHEDFERIVSSNNQFAFEWLKEVERDEAGNKVLSPISLFIVLSIVLNGADGETKEEIAKVLHMKGPLNKVNQGIASMINILKNITNMELNLANSLWLNHHFHFQDDFSKNIRTFFNGEMKEIDVRNEKSVKLINDWVTKATNQQIEKIIDSPLDPNLVVLLLNAISFKGKWTYPFDKKLTKEQPFYLENGKTKDMPFMILENELYFLENEQFQAVSLPYGNKEISMVIFVPKKEHSLTELEEMVTNEHWESWLEQFSLQEGTIILPKFQMEYEGDVTESLVNLGMKTAFDEGANFSKMIKENDPIWISEVKQKTRIEINEEGTEASAVTSGEMKTTSAPLDPPFLMEVNRPFFFVIAEEKLGAILFTGSIYNP